MRIFAMVAVLVIAGCTEPRANAVVRITPSGVSVVPVVTGSVGGVGVAVSP